MDEFSEIQNGGKLENAKIEGLIASVASSRTLGRQRSMIAAVSAWRLPILALECAIEGKPRFVSHLRGDLGRAPWTRRQQFKRWIDSTRCWPYLQAAPNDTALNTIGTAYCRCMRLSKVKSGIVCGMTRCGTRLQTSTSISGGSPTRNWLREATIRLFGLNMIGVNAAKTSSHATFVMEP